MQMPHKKDSRFVYIDPHILCTPAIADIDGDGRDELVVAVSYFFDREYYDEPEHAQEVQGLDITKYVAGERGGARWSVLANDSVGAANAAQLALTVAGWWSRVCAFLHAGVLLCNGWRHVDGSCA
jgi:hypothetical protein